MIFLFKSARNCCEVSRILQFPCIISLSKNQGSLLCAISYKTSIVVAHGTHNAKYEFSNVR